MYLILIALASIQVMHVMPITIFMDEATYEDEIGLLKANLSRRKENQKIVLNRNQGQAHCPRPHDYKTSALLLDISRLDKVLKVIDMEDLSDEIKASIPEEFIHDKMIGGVAVAGALTSMETLVDSLLPRDLVPAVVPEFKGITVGGSIQGLAAESSSSKYGFFHDIVIGFEALLPNGTRLWASRQENSDLFHGMIGSFGTIAIVTRATFLCLKAKRYVEVSVTTHVSVDDCVNDLAHRHDNMMGDRIMSDAMYLEGFGFSETLFATVQGRLISDEDITATTSLLKCNVIGSRWFFNQIKHAIKKSKNRNKGIDSDKTASLHTPSSLMTKKATITLVYSLKDYLFRHDRGSFWMASYRIPQAIGRLMGSLLDSTNMFKLANAFPWAFPKNVICLQDFMLPRATVVPFFKALENQLNLWPMWLLPMRNLQSTRNGTIFAQPSSLPNGEHLCNVGAYGIPRQKYEFIEANTNMEKILHEYGGRKVFYSHAFYDRDTFYNKIYDGKAYFNLRSNYGSENAFPEIIDKVVTKDGKL